MNQRIYFTFCLSYLALIGVFFFNKTFPNSLLVEMGIIETSSAAAHLLSVVLYIKLLLRRSGQSHFYVGFLLSFFFFLEELSYGLVIKEEWMQSYSFSFQLFRIDSLHDFLSIILLKLKKLPLILVCGIFLMLISGLLLFFFPRLQFVIKKMEYEKKIFYLKYFLVFSFFLLALYLDSFARYEWQKFLEETLELSASLVNLSIPIAFLSHFSISSIKE